ncbi:PIN domain-like protein [Panaeolus papilionaceus]|nr:PIN domain-like protein [Panaeolus papilionaceus]
MGVRNLWRAVANAAEERSLTKVAYDMHVDAILSGRDRVIPCFGVDLNLLMDTCIAASIAHGVHGQSMSLQIFFHKLAAFSEVKATFVFVPDGDKRPAIKRGHQVRHEVWWTFVVEDLIHAFGFRVHKALGEAEAELAMLNHSGVIDAVISNDSDTLVFGAETVIKIFTDQFLRAHQLPRDTVEVYTNGRIARQAHLSMGGLILFALLNGGDYDATGIPNCGAIIAKALCRCGYGDELLEATRAYLINDDNPTAFDHFIQDWRNRLCDELHNNTHQQLTFRRPDLAHAIESSDFPKREVLMAYVTPLTTEHEPSTITGARFESWYLFHEPMLPTIAQFCRTHLLWSELSLRKRLMTQLFPSIVIRMLYSLITGFSTSTNRLLGPTLYVTVNSISWKIRKGQFRRQYGSLPQPRLTVSVGSLL